ncbi:prostate stem cell antigen [Melanotaenia boesemani]|uniref:prostate stem cell antigen n=1 Tax=Melanotaenia boesemani TaxID=1250792 RepID=UPI001C052066|nr:prostate stem cell antigen [Melanotaenia boesemani]
MNRVIFLFVVGVCFAVGQALTCYKCDIGFGNLCLTTQTTCSAGQQCFNGVGKAGGFLDIKMKGCLDVVKCNGTENINFPSSSSSNSTIYSMNKTCCSTDLCNAAPGLPGTSVLSLAFAAISALIATNVLV